MSTVTLHIEGMSCGHCLNAVSRALHAIPGVTVQSVQIGRAELEVERASLGNDATAAVTAAGYRATAVVRE